MGPAIDEEMEHRRILLRLAAKGDLQTRRELEEEEYHARLFSATELARYMPAAEEALRAAAAQRKLDSL
jgi:hypothetical protein